jgi:hypothetical protein
MYKQEAIIFTKDNAELIAGQLAYTTAQDLLDDHDYLFQPGTVLVLVRDVFDDGLTLLSHVVTMSMFLANATASELSDSTFNSVTQL